MTTPTAEEITARVAALSPAKRRLLALRAGDAVPREEGAASRLVAFVDATADVDADDLRRFVGEQLPHYMTPTRVVVLPSIPRTPNGKIDRAQLERLARKQATPSTSLHPPARDELEARLAAIWCDLLGLDNVGAHDDFFALGGHSLLAVRMLARVKAELGQDVPVALIAETPTVGRIAEYIRAASATATVAGAPAGGTITPLQPHGELPPLYLLPLHVHGALHYRHLKEQLGADRPLYGFAGFDVLGVEPTPTIESLAHGYLEALLAFQPRGPYYLGGISVAGLLAYEMARQLRARGVTDVAVALFDTWGPGYPRRLSWAASLAQAVTEVTGGRGDGVHPAANALDQLLRPFEQGYATVKMLRARVRRARHTASAAGSASADPDLHMADVDAALGAMTAAYLAQAHPYDGPVALFRAGLQPWDARHDTTLGWSNIVTGALSVAHVRGDHLGILRRRHVASLAGALRWHLTQLDRMLGFAPTEG
jgi:thioesterase domain-containing protein/acyl carrier protein